MKEKFGLELNKLLTLCFLFYSSLIKDYKFVMSLTLNFFNKSMLPSTCRQHYQELKCALEQLKITLSQAKRAGADLAASDFVRIQRFQQPAMQTEELLPELESRVRSYQTEINKQLRLLGADFTFLKAARQANTQQQRRTQICDRLQVLISYCDALLPDDNKPGSV